MPKTGLAAEGDTGVARVARRGTGSRPPSELGSNAKPRTTRGLRLAENLVPYLMVVPTLAILAIMRFYPLLRGAYFSFTGDGDLNGAWVGLNNYRLLLDDPRFIASFKHVLYLMLMLPVAVIIPLLIAALIHSRIPGHQVYRAVYFFPVVLSPVIIGAIFNSLLAVDGPINSLLERFGIPGQDWLGDPTWALLSVMGVQIWSTFGLAVTIFLAGLSTLDRELTDAAKVDGANLAQSIRHIIIPSLRPTIQFVVVTTTIGMLTGMFGLLFVMTAGGPFDSTYLPELYIWTKQGRDAQPALASAASMTLFAVMAVVAMVQIRLLSDDPEAM